MRARPASAVRTSAGAVSIAVVTVLPMFLTAGLAVQIGDDLGFRSAELAAAPAAFFSAMVVGSPFSGGLVRRYGAVRVVRVLVLCVGVLMAVVAATVQTLPALVACLAAAGLLNALAQPATNHLLAQHIHPARQGTAYGAKYSAIPVSSLLAGLSVPALGLTWGWRWAFVVFAVISLLVAAYPFGDLRGGVRGPAPEPSNVRLPRWILVTLAVGVFFAASGGSTLAIFMVASAVDTGWSEGEAGLLLAVASALGVLSRLVSGLLADRRGRNHLLAVAVMLTIGAGGVLAMASGSLMVFAVGAPVAFAAGWGWPGVFVLSVVNLNPTVPAAATAITQMGTSAGCVFGPLVFGLVVQHASFRAAWMTNASVLVLAAVVILLGRQHVLKYVSTLAPGSVPWRPRPDRTRQGRTA